MKHKMKIALVSHSREQGFAVPIAIGLGFIILLIATTLIIRSQEDRVTASAQKATAQSLAVAEGGITRSLSTLKQLHKGAYFRLNYDSLNSTTAQTHLGPDAILNSGDEETTAVNQWSNPPYTVPCSTANSSPPNLVSGKMGTSGNYTIKAYRYRDPDGNPRTGDETGHLLIEGTHRKAGSQIQVSIPITQTAIAGSFPGLSADNINLGNNDVLKATGNHGSAANVICKDCILPSSGCDANEPTPAGLNSAVGRGPNSKIDGKIFIGDPQLPPVPAPPTTACSTITLAAREVCAITLPLNELTPGNGEKILPRISDLATHQPGTPFHYKISSLDFSGSRGQLTIYTRTRTTHLNANADLGATSINLTTVDGLAVNDQLSVGSDSGIYTIDGISGNTLTITPSIATAQPLGSVVAKPTNTTHNPYGDPVYLYVSGNIRFSGSASIIHTGSPELLRIYGNAADPNNATTDQQFTLNGGASTSNLFIYAPDASLGINGGSSKPDINGAVWVKTWNGSSSNNTEIRIPDNMPTLLGGVFTGAGIQTYTNSPISSWQRQPVTTP